MNDSALLEIIPTSTQLTDIGKVFRFMKLEESMAGEDSKSEERCSELAGTHFTIKKIKFQGKFQISKWPELD